MLRKLFAAACFAAMLVPGAASAQTFAFNFFAPSVGTVAVTGSGQASSSTGSSPYLLTSISGTLVTTPAFGPGTFNIVGIVAPGGANGNDNIFSLTGPTFVTGNGVGFLLDGGGGRININFQGGNYVLTALDVATGSSPTSSGVITSGSVTQIAAVPGPIAGAGLVPLLGLVGAWYVRRRKQLAA